MSISACRSTYQGDEVLARMLRAAGSVYDLPALRELVAGVRAAAVRPESEEWTRLVVTDPSPALVAQLQALKAEIGASAEPQAPDRATLSVRLAALRTKLAELEIDGFLIPRSDEYQNEYVPACNERLAWATGFTGSAGLAIVLAQRAAIFVDGRYTLQAATQVDAANFEIRHVTDQPPESWLEEALAPGQRLGFDPWLLTPDQVVRYEAVALRRGATLFAVATNPLDAAWTDRPPQPLGPVMAYDVARSGRSSSDKRVDIAAELRREAQDALVLTTPDSIAWLLNIRGSDVPRTPLPLSFALMENDGRVRLFIDHRKLLPGVEEYLGDEVTVLPPIALGPALDALKGRRVRLDPTGAPAWVLRRLELAGAEIVRAVDPVKLPKACKNAVELQGIRDAHRRDGVAMVRFLAWLAREQPKGGLREIAASDRLEAFRAEGEGFRDLSFDTISGAGPNGAIVHYRASPESERELESGSFYLLDSGAQYLDGTTDITRTLAMGTPDAEMKDRYTRVLKGHIGLAAAIFIKGTPGAALDLLARQSLWQAGLNYDHGTGHGVGHYLGVHEGPQRVHFQSKDGQALLPGMVISDEPGYYKTGAWGIRIENLVAVRARDVPGAERAMLEFETLTLCPIDKAPIDPGLMSAEEISWLDRYHARVHDELSPLIAEDWVRDWLAEATAPLRLAS